MIWLVKNKDGSEEMFQNEPFYNEKGYWSDCDYVREVRDILGIVQETVDDDTGIDVPVGTIKRLLGREIECDIPIQIVEYDR